MARLTVAQMREKELERLVAFKTDTPTDEDYAEAKRLMNSFYRLCGLAETNLYLANNERTCNSAATKRSEERESAWYDRLRKEFEEKYGLTLFYTGYAPSIGVRCPGGGVAEKITRYFYD